MKIRVFRIDFKSLKHYSIHALAIVGFISLFFLIFGSYFYQLYGITSFGRDHQWYYTSGVQVYNRWLFSENRHLIMNEISSDDFYKACGKRAFVINDYWFYRKECSPF